MIFKILLLAVFGFFCTGLVPARAELSDVNFAAQDRTAKILFSFDGQPKDVKVFVTEYGMDVDILGIEGQATELFPAAELFQSLKQIPAPGGVRFRMKLSEQAIETSAQIFQNSVLVTVHFPNEINNAKDALVFAEVSKPKPKPAVIKPVTKTKPVPTDHVATKKSKKLAQAKVSQESHHAAASADATATEHHGPELVSKPEKDVDEEIFQQTGNDGEPAPKRIILPKPVMGQGMIRKASLKVAHNLSDEQCAASEEIVAEDPWALENLARFGACLAREGKAKDAKEVFERLLTFDPETFAAYVGLGAIAQDAGEMKTARQYYEEALSLGGADSKAAQARDLLRSLGDRSE